MIPQETLAQLLGPLGLLVGTLLAIVALVREWIVPGPAFRRQVRETEMWRRLAVTNSSLAKGFQQLATERAQAEQETMP